MITSTINAHVIIEHVNIEMLKNFLIPLRENWFGDEVMSQDNNTPCHKAKRIKVFLQERHIKSIIWTVNCPYLNQTENIRGNFKNDR